MSAIECNADLGHPCDADDGRPCPSCRAYEAEMYAEYCGTPEAVRRLDMTSEEERNRQLVDAGRGHFVRVR